MNKKEFLQEIIGLFDDINDSNVKCRLKAYNLVLTDDVNYDDLYKNIIKSTKSFRYAPTPAEILEYTKKYRPYNPYA